MSGYYSDTWEGDDWTYPSNEQWYGGDDGYAYGATQQQELAYSSMVAQPASGQAGRDYRKTPDHAPPQWHGDPTSLDLWTNRLMDWAAATRTPPERQAYQVLGTLPVKAQARLRQDCNKARLSATSWREMVTKEDVPGFT